MEQSNRRDTSVAIWLDWRFAIRTIGRWIIPILSLSTFLMAATYIAGDMRRSDSYTVTTLVSVIPREYSSYYMLDNINDNAVTRNVNMWNSNVLMKEIRKLAPDREINGYLQAGGIKNTNLVQLHATAQTAQEAFFLLNSAVHIYPRIINSFDKTHMIVLMTDTSKCQVTVTKPNLLKYSSLIFALSLIGCCGLLGLWTLVTSLIHSEAQAEAMLDIPVFDCLPEIHKKKGEKAVLLTNPSTSLDYLETLDRIASRLGQCMLKNHQKSVMVTSIQENEGKTTVAVNIAIDLAQKGNKVLLVDLDFRHPSVAIILDQPENVYMSCSDGLQEGHTLKDMITIREDLGNLHVIFQHQAIHDADQLLESIDLRMQLRELAENYDYIIVDTPPMGPVRDPDVIARIVDASFLIIREEMNYAYIINDITDQLDEFGSTCIGGVLNRCHGIKRRPHAETGHKAYRNRYTKGGTRA